MNIIQIIPGSGGSFYCGNCLRDSKFYQALRLSGHQVVKIPLYLPLFADEHDIKDIPVFYGAVSVYLKQSFRVFRNMPSWMDKMLNSKPMLKLAANMSGSTDAGGLEEMTISMLLGERGQQKEELDKLISWMKAHCKPDVIHLSNALLLGMAGEIKKQLDVPVICSLQDEDQWVDAMHPDYQDQVWKLMEKQAEYVDHFIAVSDYFANLSKSRMHIDDKKLSVIHLGVDPSNYTYLNSSKKKRTIGFISRMSYENGLDILTDAFIILKKNEAFKDVELHISGGLTGADKNFFHQVKHNLKVNDLMDQVFFYDDFEDEGRKLFFQNVSMLSVPVRKGEAFGIYLTEAMAAGIPVIQPQLGAFPEIVEISEGGFIYHQNTPEELSKAISAVLNNPEMLSQKSLKARESIENKFNIHHLSHDMIELFSKTIHDKSINKT